MRRALELVLVVALVATIGAPAVATPAPPTVHANATTPHAGWGIPALTNEQIRQQVEQAEAVSSARRATGAYAGGSIPALTDGQIRCQVARAEAAGE